MRAIRNLESTLRAALGSSDRNVRRFQVESIKTDPIDRTRRIVSIRWAINDDISAGTVGNGGQVDAYAIARGVFAAKLPVSRLFMEGTYPTASAGGLRTERRVMALSVGRHEVRAIERAGWETVDAQAFWGLLHRTYVAPEFQPQSVG